MIGAHDVVEDLLAVERHHRLEAVLRHHLDGLAAGDRHPDVDRQVLRPRHQGDVLDGVAAILDRRRRLVVLALVVERLLVEAGQQELQLLLEQLAVLLGVEHRRAERLDLAGVVAAPDPHDDAAVGDDVGHRVVLGHADRMPHRQHVEGAAELEPLGLGGEPQAELDQVGEDLVALALEVVLGGPQHVEAEVVHRAGDVARGEERLAQPLVRVAPVVRRRAVAADVVELDLADVEDVEFLDHGVSSREALRVSQGRLRRDYATSRRLGKGARPQSRCDLQRVKISDGRRGLRPVTRAR